MLDRPRTAQSSLAALQTMRSSFRALLSALLQLARIQTDSVVEMLHELYPDLCFEIGKLFRSCPGVGGSSTLSLCARGVCRALSEEQEDSAQLIYECHLDSVRTCG